jgi:cystathionine beta-lyase/cystathionine gamma-synthase
MVTFDLAGGAEHAERFIRAAHEDIPFCPSLGEVSTTLSHPASTSHRGHSAEQLGALGIGPETIRLSVGTESASELLEKLAGLVFSGYSR